MASALMKVSVKKQELAFRHYWPAAAVDRSTSSDTHQRIRVRQFSFSTSDLSNGQDVHNVPGPAAAGEGVPLRLAHAGVHGTCLTDEYAFYIQ